MAFVWLIPLGFSGVAVVCDLRRREIPDGIPALLAALGLAASLLGWTSLPWSHVLLGGLCGLAIGGLFFFAAGFGGGDVKLVAALGTWLGVWGLLQTLFWVALAGMLLAFVAQARGKKEFAYAPALFAGLLVFLIWPTGLHQVVVWTQGIAGR
ncbi:MAG: A24 family peptidase [Planctomycetaceae bacterium]|nr:A24 family peptidase [Planctomycetaceae bacterium]